MSRDRQLSVNRAITNGSISTDDAHDVVDVIVHEWRGALGEASTTFWPLNAIGSTQITITFAGEEVLVPKQIGAAKTVGIALDANAILNAAGMTYEISDAYMTLDTISFSDNLYESLIRERLSQGNLEIMYKNYYSFSQDGIATGDSATRFSVAATSINKIYSTKRNGSYRTKSIQGHKITDHAFGEDAVGNYFRFMSFDDRKGKVGGNMKTSHTINNVMTPQYKQKTIESLGDLVTYSEKFGASADGILQTSLAGYHEGLYVNCVSLMHPVGDMIAQTGYDSRGISSNLVFEVQGALVPGTNVGGSGNLYPATAGQAGTISHFVVVETVAKMIIGLGREVAVQF
jgi:hypothetical protein